MAARSSYFLRGLNSVYRETWEWLQPLPAPRCTPGTPSVAPSAFGVALRSTVPTFEAAAMSHIIVPHIAAQGALFVVLSLLTVSVAWPSVMTTERVARGKLADVIVVDGDPLRDIADMANVSIVVRNGEVIVGHTREPLPTARPTFGGVPGLTPTPTPAAVFGLPDTGEAAEGGGFRVWAVTFGMLVLAVALVAAGGMLASRRR